MAHETLSPIHRLLLVATVTAATLMLAGLVGFGNTASDSADPGSAEADPPAVLVQTG